MMKEIKNSDQFDINIANENNDNREGIMTYAKQYSIDAEKYRTIALNQLPFPVRAMNCFKAQHWYSLADLLEQSAESLMNLKNMGNGTVHIIENILYDFFDKYGKLKISDFYNMDGFQEFGKSFAENYNVDTEYYRERKIEVLGLSVRELNRLHVVSCETIADLLAYSESSLGEIDNLGIKSINHIVQCIKEYIEKEKNINEISNKEIDVQFAGLNISLKNKLVKPFVVAYCQSHNLPSDSILFSVDDKQCFNDFFESYTSNNVYIDKEDVLRFIRWVNIDTVSLKNEIIDAAFRGMKKNERSVLLALSMTDKNGKHCRLNDIGKLLNVTRQRIDQLAKKARIKFLNNVFYSKYPMVFWAYATTNGKKVLELKDLQTVFGEQLAFCIFYCANKTTQFELDSVFYFRELKCFFVNEKKDTIMTVKKMVKTLPPTIKTDELNLMIDEMSVESGIDRIYFEIFINSYYKKYGIFSSTEKISISFIRKYVFKEEFPNGFEISNQENYIRFRAKIKKIFGIEDETDNRRISNVLGEIGVLCGRGRYISIEHVKYSQSLLDEIVAYVENGENTSLYYSELFTHFRQRLCNETSINNYEFLHGMLKYLYSDIIDCCTDQVTKKNYKPISAHDRLLKLLFENGPMSFDAVRAKIPIMSDEYIGNMISHSDEIVNWGGRRVNAVSNIKITDNEKTHLLMVLRRLTEENKGFCSLGILYDKIVETMPNFLKDNKLDEMSLFYTVSAIFKSYFRCVRGNIYANTVSGSINSQFDIFMEILYPDNAIVNYNQIKDIFKKYKWSEATLSVFMHNLEKTYFQVDINTYVKKTDFVIPEYALMELKKRIDGILSVHGYLGVFNIEVLGSLPLIKYKWTSHLLNAIIEKYGMGYKVVRPNQTDRRYKREIIIYESNPAKTYIDLIFNILHAEEIYFIDENSLSKFLEDRGLLSNRFVPYDFYQDKNVKFYAGEFTYTFN